jgi:hypothetical protein
MSITTNNIYYLSPRVKQIPAMLHFAPPNKITTCSSPGPCIHRVDSIAISEVRLGPEIMAILLA